MQRYGNRFSRPLRGLAEMAIGLVYPRPAPGATIFRPLCELFSWKQKASDISRSHFGSLLAILLLTAPAWTQSAPYTVPAASVEDQFSAYQQAANRAADSQLTGAFVPDRGSLSPQPTSEIETPRPDNNALRQFARQYWAGQEQNVLRAVERIARLRPALEPILHEEGVPSDLVALALIESGGHTMALSPKGAFGLWQFMPDTARRYGLVVSPGRDERADVVKSTHAAARYLRDLHSQFGDWSLAFAAFNAGEQAVQRAIAENGTGDFESLSRNRRLPPETRNYVPAVLSAMRLLGGNLPAGQPSQRPMKVGVVYANATLGQ